MFIGINGISVTNTGGVKAFSPKQISGLQLWLTATAGTLDANNNPITVDNTAIKTWQDQSGNNRHAIQATVASQPLVRLGANGINGLPAIQWDTTAKFLAANYNLFTTTVTAFLVVKYADSTTRYCSLDLKGGFPNHFAIEQNTYNAPNKNAMVAGGTTLYTSGASSTNAQVISISATTGTGTTPIIANTVYKTNKTVQTLTISSGTTNYINYSTISNYTIGSFTPGNILGMKGYVCEVIVYNAVLAADDVLKVEDYLKAKWGI